MEQRTCHINDACSTTGRLKRGLCSRHYQWAMKTGVLARYSAPPVPPLYCNVDGCSVLARPGRQGMCNAHALRVYRYNDVNFLTPNPKRNGVEPCSVVGCEKVSKAYLMCVTHATRFGRYGDAAQRGKTCECEICGALFTKYGRQRCCSVECRKELVALSGYTARRKALEQEATIERFSRAEIFERDGWVCQLCNEPVDRNARARSSRSASLDHIIPLTKGGQHSRANTQCAHFGCNARKRDRVDTTPI